ncbi:MAG: biopolymer transporter ExbD [Rhodospirillaceae bacterium]|nr:biopolymer transporter ExbD [Rhodospirillaceae bacterium]
MSKRARKAPDEAEIDMTPMLDVTFIMLIFFIVTASFTKENGIDLSQSNNDTLQQQNTKNVSIVIDINGNDEVVMEGRTVDPRSVQANVQRLRAENPEANVVVRAAAAAKAQTLVTVVDQARLAGVSGVVISELGG